MEKKGKFGISAAVFCLAATAASAQDRPVTSHQDRPDTIKINLSGRILMDAVWRSNEVTSLTEGFTGGATSDSENWIQGEVMIRLDAELSDKISGVLELGKRQTENFGGPSDIIGDFSGGEAEDIRLSEAHVTIQEFLTPALRAQLGISTWSFDVRGKGRAMAFDPRHSQSATRSFRRTEDTLAEWASRSDEPKELNPVGIMLTYSKDDLRVDVVALPMVLEGGSPSQDEALYAVDFWYTLDSMVGNGSRMGLIVALSGLGPQLPVNVSSGKTSVVTVGGGIVLNGFIDGLELYCEDYLQFGNAGKFTVAGQEEDAKARGAEGQAGFEYRLPGNENAIWFGANVTYVSGDDDDDLDDDNVDTFLGYENVRDLLILEDMYFGFDVDQNYIAVKLMAGISFSVGAGRNNLELAAIAGFCRSTREVLLPSGEHEDKLGNEFDLRATLHVNRQITFRAALAWLSGSDLLEESMGGSAVSEAKDTGGLVSLGVDARF